MNPFLKRRIKKQVGEVKTATPPPPAKEAPRHLSLRTAIAAASRREGDEYQPRYVSNHEFSPIKTESGKLLEMEAKLLELQAEIIIREDGLSLREKKLEARELELNEREALLQAHRKLVESKFNNTAKGHYSDPKEVSEEAKALEELQRQLESQEASLRQARHMLQEREKFIEKCENDLVEQSMLLSEREARLEQNEEDSEAEKRRRQATQKA
jgi:hypothetical protein